MENIGFALILTAVYSENIESIEVIQMNALQMIKLADTYRCDLIKHFFLHLGTIIDHSYQNTLPVRSQNMKDRKNLLL